VNDALKPVLDKIAESDGFILNAKSAGKKFALKTATKHMK
jgi:hypothetical protein